MKAIKDYWKEVGAQPKVTAKRGRGRPRKTKGSSSSSSSSSASDPYKKNYPNAKKRGQEGLRNDFGW